MGENNLIITETLVLTFLCIPQATEIFFLGEGYLSYTKEMVVIAEDWRLKPK